MAKQAVSPLLRVILFGEETPINGDSARVSQNGLSHTPDEQREYEMEDDDYGKLESGGEGEQILDEEDKVVEAHEGEDSNEVRVDELAAVELAMGHSNEFFIVIFEN